MSPSESSGTHEYSRGYKDGVGVERKRCLKVVEQWLRPDHVRLHAGEMGAQEMRSVLAVVTAIAASVQNY